MTLKEELDALRPLMGTESGEFYSRVKHIADTYTSEGDKKMIADFMDECLNGISGEIAGMEERTIKLQLQNISEIISLSFIAKHYFGKRKNGYISVLMVMWSMGSPADSLPRSWTDSIMR